MFERFVDAARRVVVLAQEEARLLNHNHIGTEHLLLGLIHEGGGAARILEGYGLTLQATRDRVREIVGVGPTMPSGHIPFTPDAKKAMEFALREALQLGHNFIASEHLLLGLVRQGEGAGGRIVAEHADLHELRRRVTEAAVSDAEERGVFSGAPWRDEEPLGPRCPRCRAPLREHLTCEVVETGSERVTVAYCGNCSTALGVLGSGREPGSDG